MWYIKEIKLKGTLTRSTLSVNSSNEDLNRLMSFDEFLNDQSENSDVPIYESHHTTVKEITHQGYLDLKIKKNRWERWVW